ncbi:MAG TPA: hypothetical protein VHW95_13535 [Steroidobacteraceae bacterium]|jgi:dihydroxyacid dehydratase/phosphogluconate dehydratase|nr:hypothetical protein [Steroidobacteraceae bacterium]
MREMLSPTSAIMGQGLGDSVHSLPMDGAPEAGAVADPLPAAANGGKAS